MSITGMQVVNKVREIAKADPTHLYQRPASHPAKTDETGGTCFYVHHDENGVHTQTAGCLIGQALAALGVSLDALSEWENKPGDAAAQGVGIRLTPAESNFIIVAQTMQDQGRSWGEALDRAEQRTESYYPEWDQN